VLASFAQADLEPRLAGQRLHSSHAARHHDAVVQADTPAKPAECASVWYAMHLHVIDALDAVRRMQQAVRQRAVVRQEQQAAALEVESTDGINALAELGEQLPHGRAPLRIGQRADDAARLVQHDGARWRAPRKPLPVECDLVPQRIGACSQLADHRAVHAHAPGTDQLLGVAPRGDAEPAQDLLQALGQPS